MRPDEEVKRHGLPLCSSISRESIMKSSLLELLRYCSPEQTKSDKMEWLFMEFMAVLECESPSDG